MKLFLVSCLFILSFSALAEVESELSGNIEAQARNATNNPDAKKDLLQDWDNENFYLLYGNLNGKLEMNNSRLESNWFLRYSKSELYDPEPNIFGNSDPYLVTVLYNFPPKLVARDLFGLQHKKQEGDHQFESVINKLYYEVNIEENRLMFGRMYVNYGLGEIFNPVNPFNQPTGLTSISQVAQGNDGASLMAFVSDTHTVQVLFLGNKVDDHDDDEDNDISRTFWAHGEYQASDELQLDYVFGEDQDRYKVGGQVSYRFEEAMVFTQLLYQSQSLKADESNTLVDALLGFDQQMTNIWHVRMESGYQKANRFATLADFERFLPIEYFLAIANVVEVHPLVKLTGTLMSDIKTGFTYVILKSTFDIGHDMEAEIFASGPLGKGHAADNVAQELVTTDVGLALRAFF
jgi:hypothetical protein